MFLIPMLLFLAGPAMVLAEEAHHPSFHKVLKDFIDQAHKNNPALKEAENKINLYGEIPDQKSAWKDPMLMVGLANMPVDTFSFREQPMTQKQIQLTQEIPFPGKMDLRARAAEEDTNIARWNLKELKLKITRQVKEAFFELCFINSAIDTTEQNKVLLKQFITIAESKYSVGKGIQQDVLRAQVEYSKIIDELIELRQRKANETARLNTLMNRLPQEPLNIPHGLTQTEFKFTVDQLQGMALKNRPFLQSIQTAIDKFKLNRQIAEKEYYPNFQVGIRYGQRQDSQMQDHPDFLSGFIGVNIPIWFASKQKKKVAEESYRIQTAKDSFQVAKNDIFLKIKIITDKEEKGRKLIGLIQNGIIPQAKQSLESALVAYSVNKIDFLTLIDNQVTLLKWKIKSHRELTDYEQNLAALEHVVGQSLFLPYP